MIIASDIVLFVRQKLNDKDDKRYKYSTTEIIDAINITLAKVSDKLLCFNREWIISLDSKIDRYPLPNDFLRLISINHNGRKVYDVNSLDAMAHKKHMCYTNSVTLDMNSIRLSYGVKDDSSIVIIYNYIEQLHDEDSRLEVPISFMETLAYGALFVLLQNPVLKDGMSKAIAYNTLYENALNQIVSRTRSNHQSKKIITRYRSV